MVRFQKLATWRSVARPSIGPWSRKIREPRRKTTTSEEEWEGTNKHVACVVRVLRVFSFFFFDSKENSASPLWAGCPASFPSSPKKREKEKL